MNAIDLIVCLVAVLAVWNGWRRGFILQICSLVGLLAAIFLAARFGAPVGEWLKLDPAVAAAGGFAAVLVVVLIAVAVAGRLLRKIFQFAGFGLLDVVLGIAVSLLKYMLLLSALFAAFETLNRDYALVEPQVIEESRTFRPVAGLSERILPFLEELGTAATSEIESPAPETPQPALPEEAAAEPESVI